MHYIQVLKIDFVYCSIVIIDVQSKGSFVVLTGTIYNEYWEIDFTNSVINNFEFMWKTTLREFIYHYSMYHNQPALLLMQHKVLFLLLIYHNNKFQSSKINSQQYEFVKKKLLLNVKMYC